MIVIWMASRKITHLMLVGVKESRSVRSSNRVEEQYGVESNEPAAATDADSATKVLFTTAASPLRVLPLSGPEWKKPVNLEFWQPIDVCDAFTSEIPMSYIYEEIST